MKTTGRSRILAAAIVAAAAVASMPDPAPGADALTLREAMTEAIRASDLMRAEEGRRAAAESAVDAARANLLPGVTLEERFLRTDNPAYDFSLKINQGAFTGADLQGAPGSFNDPAAISDFQTTLSLTQPLYARRATIGLAMARGEAEAAGLDHARRREEVVHAALQAWLGSKAVEAYVDAAAQAERDAAEHLRLAQVAEDAGVGLASDRLRASVALAEARRMRLTVENDLEIARRGLGLALGREGAVTATDDDLGATLPDVEALVERAGLRADLQAMGRRVENAGRAAELARAEGLPEVGLFASLQANDPDQPLGSAGTSYSAGVALTWKLFAGGRIAAAERQARAQQRSAASLLEAMGKEARFRVREAWLRWREATANRRIAEEARTAAEEGVRLVRVRYENGLATMVALIDAQAALDRARSEAASAAAQVAAALAEVRFRAGLLLEGVEVSGRTRGHGRAGR